MTSTLQPLTSPAGQAALAQVRLIATDMDGTLTESGQFTAPLLTMLKRLQAANVPVVITTGRSTGWVSAVIHYLPVVGAMAENGGVYLSKDNPHPHLMAPGLDIAAHRQTLKAQFDRLCQTYPNLQEAPDNRFRLTDWTYDVAGLTDADLSWMEDSCQANGFSFTYSTVQCHIKPGTQDKANGLKRTIAAHFPHLSAHQVLTVGDSPNDESLFNADLFPNSAGVANVRHYLGQLAHHPAFVTQAKEIEGFCEISHLLLTHQSAGQAV
ncbi:MAG: HAD family hydrolase [Cyanobacteria bacterium J06628_6]